MARVTQINFLGIELMHQNKKVRHSAVFHGNRKYPVKAVNGLSAEALDGAIIVVTAC